MKISIILTLLAVVGALASPQRPLKRFFPRRGQNEVAPPVADAPENDIVEEPETPKFRIGGQPRESLISETENEAAPEEEQPAAPRIRRPSSSSFIPRKNLAPVPDFSETSEGSPSEAVDGPSTRPSSNRLTQSQPSNAASRTRGSTTFIQSLKQGTIPIEPSQIEELERLQASGGRLPSRTPSRAPPASRPVSRVASRRPASQHGVAPQPQVAAVEPQALVEQTARISEGDDDKSSRRQRLLQLKRRPRVGPGSATGETHEPVLEARELAEDIPEKMVKPESEQPSDDQMLRQVQETHADLHIVGLRLDEQETKTLDETLKSETPMKLEEMTKETMHDVKETLKTAEDSLPSLDAPEAAAPEEPLPVTITTAAPKRKVATLTRLRNSRPAASSEAGTRSTPRSRIPATPTVTRPSGPGSSRTPGTGSTTSTPPARLSNRRGGRGNSRGGAAVAAAARTPSTGTADSSRTRGLSSRGRTAPEEVPAEVPAEEEPASAPLVRRRRQFPSLSARLARRAQPAIATSARHNAPRDPERSPARIPTLRADNIPVDRKIARKKNIRTLVQRLRDRQNQETSKDAVAESDSKHDSVDAVQSEKEVTENVTPKVVEEHSTLQKPVDAPDTDTNVNTELLTSQNNAKTTPAQGRTIKRPAIRKRFRTKIFKAGQPIQGSATSESELTSTPPKTSTTTIISTTSTSTETTNESSATPDHSTTSIKTSEPFTTTPTSSPTKTTTSPSLTTTLAPTTTSASTTTSTMTTAIETTPAPATATSATPAPTTVTTTTP
ncbi:mucin-5AC, partial [Hyalella azteca]|uniref:Mucin-5AC n=1 Tax=Hyalella azteca TaxID=294128 RepID=A0A8B7NJ15_HYAAZ